MLLYVLICSSTEQDSLNDETIEDDDNDADSDSSDSGVLKNAKNAQGMLMWYYTVSPKKPDPCYLLQ